MSGITIAQIVINDSSDKTITGAWVFDRDRGGSLAIPSGTIFPSSPRAGEVFWRTDENAIYRRNDSNTGWDAISGGGGGSEISELQQIHVNTREPTGFIDRTQTNISYNDITREFTIAPILSSFDFYQKGTLITKNSPESIIWDDVEGNHYFYYDGYTLTHTTDSSILELLIYGYGAYISYLYWDATNKKVLYFGEERHGCQMDGATHAYLHNVFGSQYYSGGQLTNIIVDGNGSSDGYCQFNVNDCVIADEDIKISIVDGYNQILTGPAQIPVYYRTGTDGYWRKKTADNFPIIYNGTAGYTGTTIPYNMFSAGNWSLAAIPNSNYVLTHYYATNNIDEPIIGVIGQSYYSSISLARSGSYSEINNLQGMVRIFGKEVVALATVIYQSDSLYTNTTKARIVSTDENNSPYIWHVSNVVSGISSSPQDHGSLAGLLDDDHPQYFLVNGSRAMTGDIDMGGYSISNVNLVDGIAVEAQVAASLKTSTGIVDVSAALAPTTGQVLTAIDGTNAQWSNPVSGSDGWIQFNDNGVFGSTSQFIFDKATNTLTIGSATIYPNNPLDIASDVDSYTQIIFQNKSDGVAASTDFVLNSDNGDNESYYVDLGINGSNYNDPAFSIVPAGEAYLYSSDTNLAIGSAATGGIIKFFTDGTTINDLVATISIDGLDLSAGSHYSIDGNPILPLAPAQGDILYFNGTLWDSLAPSIDGYTLTTHGSGQNPTWELNGSGDVSGPVSSTDNALVRFDGATGKIIQNSTVTLDDSGNLANVNRIDLIPTDPATVPDLEGRIFFDNQDHTLAIKTDIPGTSVQVGQEMLLRVRNITGSLIPNGSAVYKNGVQGNRPTIALAIANNEAMTHVIGLATHDIPDNDVGYVTTYGKVRDLNTNSFNENDTIYLSDSVAGGLTNIKPVGPNIVVEIGTILRKHPTLGEILLDLASPSHLADLHDVGIDGPTDGYYLRGNGTLWNSSNFNNDVLNSPSVSNLIGINQNTKDPTGFISRTTSSISYDGGTRTFSISPVSGSYQYYIKGTLYTQSSLKTITWPDVHGPHFFYFDGYNLATTQSSNDIEAIIYGSGAYISYLYWDATSNSVIYFGEERHGCQMDGATHVWLHKFVGTKYYSGGELTNIIADDTGNLDTHAQLGVNNTEIADEDIEISIQNGSPQTISTTGIIPVYYRSGTDGYWFKKTSDSFPMIYNGTAGYVGTRIAYNSFTLGTWGLTEVTNNDYILSHIWATNNIDEPIIAICGQTVYSTIVQARAGATSELANLQGVLRLFSQEATPLGTIILQTSNGYANTPKARIVSVDNDGNTYIKWTNNQITGSVATPTDHGSLGGLLDDDHTQYLIISGRGGEAQGDILYYNGSGWTSLPPSTDGYTLTTHGTGQNPTWDPVVATGLKTSSTVVSISGATAPVLGQVLTATSSTSAIWQTPSGGGGGGVSLTNNAPQDVTKSAASAGTDGYAARSDHKHDISTATPGIVNIAATSTEGTATSLARSDHTHAFAVASQAQGDILYYNGSAWVRLAAGTDGYSLITHGGGQNPTWEGILSLTSSAPQNVTKSAASVGTDIYAARADHKHDISTATASSLSVGGSNSEGVSTSLARADHTHSLPAFGAIAGTFTEGNDSRLSDDRTASGLRTASSIVSISSSIAPINGQVLVASSSTAASWTTLTASPFLTSSAPQNVTKSAASAGTDGYAARADHKHDISTAAAVALSVGGSNTEGTATSLARSDHTHSLPAFGTTSGTFAQGNDSRLSDDRTASGLRTATTVVSISGATAPSVGQSLIATSSTNAVWATLAAVTTSTSPSNVTKSAAVIGIDGYAARADHKHDISTASASSLSVGGSNSEGTSSSLARADHTHSLPAFGTTAGTFAQGNDSRFTDDRTASGLRTATTIVSISGATAPVLGQVLTATSGTNATWQTPTTGAQLTSSAPQNVTKSAAVVGTDGYAARADHKHDISTAAASTINIAGSNSEGTSSSLARADHTHAFTVTNQAQGDILYYNGSAWVRLAASNDGYVLTTHGASQNPTWEQGSGGISIAGAQQGDIIYYNGTSWTRLAASTDGYVLTTKGTGQNPLWATTPKRLVTVEYCLTEDVNNTEKYFYTWKSTAAATDSERSGNNGGLQNANTCSPYQVPFNGVIKKAVLTVRGVGVQNGSVTYPVTYQTDLFDIGFTGESKTADIDFSISNAYVVGTFSVGATNFKGSTTLNISVTEGQMLGLKFINGNSASLAGQTRNAFVTLIIEES